MRRRTRWFLIVGTLLTAMLPVLTTWARGSSPVSRQVAGPSPLYIVFLPGLCGWPHTDPDCGGKGNAGPRARHTFNALIAALGTAHVRYLPVYYSYNSAHSGAYAAGDTQQAIARSIAVLNQQIQSIRALHPDAHFDLVGHSLGGVIAADWAVTLGRRAGTGVHRGLRSFVHSLITFDSPLKGIQSDLVGALLSKVFGGRVWLDLQPGSLIVHQINGQSSAWWRSSGHLHTVANRADLIVPPGESLLGIQRLVTDTMCAQDLGFLRSCHGAVLADRSLNRYVACNWITDGQQCNASTATPTPVAPTLVPTSTPTPAMTVTSTVTPGPVTTPTSVLTPTAGGTPRPQATPPPLPVATSG